MNGFSSTEKQGSFIEVAGRTLSIIKNGQRINKDLLFEASSVCGYGKNGNMVVKTDEGVKIINVLDSGVIHLLTDFSKNSLREENAFLGDIKIDDKGKLLCIERMNYRYKLIDMVLNLLKIRKAVPHIEDRQFIFYNLEERTRRLVYVHSMYKRGKNRVRWAISPNFKYLVIIEKEYKNQKESVYIVNIAINRVLARIDVADTSAENVMVNNFGFCLFEIKKRSRKWEYVILTSNGKVIRFEKDTSTKLMHFGNKIIVFKKPKESQLIIKDLNEKTIGEFDLKPLKKLDFNYELFFNENDDIEVVLSQNGKVKVLHCSLDTFHTDVKRWQVLAEKMEKAEAIERISSRNDISPRRGRSFMNFRVDSHEALSQALYNSLTEKMDN
ncbi:MAG: hypothetical protein ABIH00_03135 [Armatimonadota bacterium]